MDGIKTYADKSGISLSTLLSDNDFYNAQKTASEADLAMVFVTADSGEGYLTIEGNYGDRNDLKLWHNGDQLIQAVASAQKTIVVINSPGAVSMDAWFNHRNVTAVIYGLFPGQESGNALADVVFGAVNPSGRAPFTVSPDGGYGAAIHRTNVSAPGLPFTQVVYSEGQLFDYR